MVYDSGFRYQHLSDGISVSIQWNYLCHQYCISYQHRTLDDVKLAQDDLGGRFFNGRIAVAMIYDRALSAGEITQNFNALRGRYGL
jgi:hypothetical protein